MKLVCLNCHNETVLDAVAQKRIADKLKTQLPTAREVFECHCGRGQFIFGLNALRKCAE